MPIIDRLYIVIYIIEEKMHNCNISMAPCYLETPHILEFLDSSFYTLVDLFATAIFYFLYGSCVCVKISKIVI